MVASAIVAYLLDVFIISLPCFQERTYLTSAATAKIKTMMTSNQTSPMAHIIPGIIPSIIMVRLT
jgi:hypothetical protein